MTNRTEFYEFVKDYIFMMAIVEAPESKPIWYTERFIPKLPKQPLHYMDSVF